MQKVARYGKHKTEAHFRVIPAQGTVENVRLEGAPPLAEGLSQLRLRPRWNRGERLKWLLQVALGVREVEL